LAAWIDQGSKRFMPFFQGSLAEIEEQGDTAGVLAQIDQAHALAGETEEHRNDAFPHRLNGAILLKRDPEHKASPEEAFLTAIAIAPWQKTRSLELRAVLDFARLYGSTSRSADAHASLASALEGFRRHPNFPRSKRRKRFLSG
jgi:hypothetical protein